MVWNYDHPSKENGTLNPQRTLRRKCQEKEFVC